MIPITYDYNELKVFIHEHLRKLALASGRSGLDKSNVAEILIMIAAHESKAGEYRVQLGGGPARGLFQMEEDTHDSIWENSDIIKDVAKRCGYHKNFDLMENDDGYATFMARMYIAMDPSPAPKYPNFQAMAKYCKSYWNRTGAATWQKYNDDYFRLRGY